MEVMYRIQQAVRALFAFTQDVDTALTVRYLSSRQMVLFDNMRHSEQLHGLHVLQDVLAQDTDTPHDLAVAALLHDVGKSRYTLRVWQKTLAVLVEKLAPPLFRRWSREDGDSYWRRPFILKVHHPAWSATMLAATGASERAIWLVAHHQDDAGQWDNHPHVHLLKRLQKADDAN